MSDFTATPEQIAQWQAERESYLSNLALVIWPMVDKMDRGELPQTTFAQLTEQLRPQFPKLVMEDVCLVVVRLQSHNARKSQP